MKNSTLIITLTSVLVVIVLGYLLWNSGRGSQKSELNAILADIPIKVYKTPTCGCCKLYVSYLRRKGISVAVEDVKDLDVIRDQYFVPDVLGSCHTMVAGEYVIEGHVPIEAIAKLFSEPNGATAIALPDMPSGSPGMPGSKREPFTIYSFSPDGEISVFMEL